MRAEQPGVRSSRRRAVEDRAVAWLAARRALLDPRSARPDSVLFTRKALIETAFLTGLRARLDDAPLTDDYASILEQVEDVAREPSYREMIARDESALLLYAGTYAALRLCGRDAPEFERIIRQAVEGGYAAAFERVPYRQLDLIHTLYLCGIEHDLSSMDDVLPFSLLCRRPNVLKLADRDVYAITHTVFYVTDFGLRDPAWPRGFRPGEGVELLEALLVLAEARANADLVGELLCCLYCLGVTDSRAADRAWAFLESVQEGNGRVNGPEGVLHPGTDDGDGDFRHWAEGYHTTVVAALAGLLERSPRRRTQPPPSPPAEDVPLRTPLRRAVMWLCDATQEQDHRSGLAGVTAAAVGASAIREHDLVRPSLERCAAHLADASPAFWQEQGMEIAGEFALALRRAGISCPSLDEHLKATADAVASFGSIPADIAAGVHRLIGLGVLDRSVASAIPRQTTHRERHFYPLHAAVSLCEARETYHLGRMAATLRALVQQGWGHHRITRDAVSFLVAQQDTGGAFGHPALDDRTARRKAQYSWTRSAVIALAAAATPGPTD
ncbi:DUF6895 family protein [Streptomyces sp. WMMC940]|uniref:DUF6895 family protein n=1 Tax=Streptomyces sp. WMMC940 TaxID=3015153 RepID=UPI0022B710B6|nr:hypothetical protein [Streptomyces sp. WMMC940]MCZ7456930.1 hypothetical protein [Streptomyces sp. WMMC940]